MEHVTRNARVGRRSVVLSRCPRVQRTAADASAPGRYARLTLDLTNQLVSNFRMEGGVAKVVVSLIEASARAGARDGAIDVAAVGGGGGADDRRRRRKYAGYFDETVDFVAQVARKGIERANEAQRQIGGNPEADQAEEAHLTLSQGLSGFLR